MSQNLPAAQAELTPEQLDLIKATVARNATDDEMKLFLHRCRTMGLDPLKPGQIHFVKYGNNPGTIIIGREGFRSRAAATGKHVGTKLGIIRDENGRCLGAWAEVYRSGWTQPAREEVSLFEYNTGKAQWAKMPETMIKKVAEVAALRMAFPDELGGLYSDDEMQQASKPHESLNEAPEPPPLNLGPPLDYPQDQPENVPSLVNRARIIGLVRKRGWNHNEVQGYIKERWGVASTRELGDLDFQALCNVIEMFTLVDALKNHKAFMAKTEEASRETKAFLAQPEPSFDP